LAAAPQSLTVIPREVRDVGVRCDVAALILGLYLGLIACIAANSMADEDDEDHP
jgi:hypothetical protein